VNVDAIAEFKVLTSSYSAENGQNSGAIVNLASIEGIEGTAGGSAYNASKGGVVLLTKNLATLLVCAPLHGVFVLLCARDARYFDLMLLWFRTRIPALLANHRLWRASSYSPLELDLPDDRGRRRRGPVDVRFPCPP